MDIAPKDLPEGTFIVSQSASEAEALKSLELRAEKRGVTLMAVVYTYGKSKTGQVYYARRVAAALEAEE